MVSTTSWFQIWSGTLSGPFCCVLQKLCKEKDGNRNFLKNSPPPCLQRRELTVCPGCGERNFSTELYNANTWRFQKTTGQVLTWSIINYWCLSVWLIDHFRNKNNVQLFISKKWLAISYKHESRLLAKLLIRLCSKIVKDVAL